MLILLIAFFLPAMVHGGVTFLAHYNQGVDADHAISGKIAGAAQGAALSPDGQGYPFPGGARVGRAADIGYAKEAADGAGIAYDSANLDIRQGTIQMWVKTSWDWSNTVQERTDKVDKTRHFLRVKLKGDVHNSLNFYFACDQGHVFLPHLAFYIRDGKRDYICNAPVGADAAVEFKWEKDTWHYLVATWTPTRMVIYADGKKLAERTFEAPMDCPMPEGPLIIGNSGPKGRPSQALIDEVRILDFALPEKEATQVPNGEFSSVIQGESLAAGGQATFYRPERRRYHAPRVTAAPTIDGDLSDAVWANIPVVSGFTHLGLEAKLEKRQSEAQAAWDDQNLYLAMFFYEERLDRLRTETKTAGDLGVFSDDATEVFLSSAEDGRPYVQLGISAGNVQCGLSYQANGDRSPWQGKPVTAVRRLANGWTIEAAIPFAQLKIKPSIGLNLRWNLCRDRRAGGGLEYSTMNFVSITFLEAAEFGHLTLAGESQFDKDERRREEAKLNHDYLTRGGADFADFISRVERETAFVKEVSRETKQAAGLLTLEEKLTDTIRRLQELRAEKTPALKDWTARFFHLTEAQKWLDNFSSKALSVAVTAPEEEVRAALSGKPGVQTRGRTFFLVSSQLAAAVDVKTGLLAGLWERKTGRRLIASGYDLYTLETRAQTRRSDERLNRVRSVEKKGASVVVTGENPDLPGLRLVKTYSLAGVEGEDRALNVRLETSGRMSEATLVSFVANCIFDEKFRRDSIYDRVFVIGTVGDGRQQVPAKEIQEPLVQHAWFSSSEGRAQFSCLNPDLGLGVGHYLLKHNDRWAFPQGYAQSWWHQFGWEMGGPAEFFKPSGDRKLSFDLRYHLFRGDRLTFHREYIGLPEYQERLKDWQPNPLVTRLYSSSVPGYEHATAHELKKWEYFRDHLLRPDDVMIGITGPDDRQWGEFPAQDGAKIVIRHPTTGKDTRVIPCENVKRQMTAVQEKFPFLKMGFYRFIIDIYKGTAIYKAHPEWVARDKKGEEAGGMFDQFCVASNMSPGFLDHLLQGLLREVDYYNEGAVYLDFSVGIWTADWGREEVTSLLPIEDWLKKLHRELQKRGKALFLNSFLGQHHCDMGFHEGEQCRSLDAWRDGGNVWLMRKLYLRKGAVCLPLYWRGGDQFKAENNDNEERYRNLILASGLTAVTCYLDPYHKHFPDGKGGTDHIALAQYTYPVHALARELIPSELVEIGLEPAWWRDFSTEFEAFTLRQGPAFLVNVISHHKNARDGVFSVDPGRMGFDRNKPVYFWQFVARGQKDFVKTAPQPEGWDRMFKEMKFATLSCKEGPLKLALDKLEPETVRVTCITQEPAFICSASGRPTQLLLPENLGCRVGGEMQAARKTLELTVTAEQPAEITAYWPFPEEPQALAGQESLTISQRKIGGASFLVFAAPKGVTKVTISPRKPKGTP